MQKPAEASWVYQAVDETTTEFASSIEYGGGPPSNELPGYAVKPVSNRFPHISRRIHSVASWCSRQALSSP
jgi:hypothetical protein